MTDQVLEFSHKLGFSKLFQDFIYSPGKLSDFFDKDDISKRADSVSERYSLRETAVDVLTRQNKKWQAPAPVMESIERLGDKNAVAVLAGQQAGLFGGPYLAVLKALAASKLSAKLEQELAVPVVPIFWIASEDHDYQEISRVDIFDAAGSLTPLNIDYDPKLAYPPVGTLSYDESIDRENQRLQSIIPDNDFKGIALDRLVEIYQSDREIVDCFAEYMLSLIGQFGVALFNPCDQQFKRSTAAIMQNIVRHHSELKRILKESATRLTSAGYHVQVEKAESSSHLFYHAPERTAIHLENGNFKAGDRVFSEEQLMHEIEDSPTDFSSDVLTRTLIQSSFFPTAVVVGGPAEIAYYAQIGGLFDLFELTRPHLAARPSMTIVEKRFEVLMNRHQIAFTDLTGEIEAVVNNILQATFPEEFDRRLQDLATGSINELKIMKEKLSVIDPGLNNAVDRAGERIESVVRDLSKKIFASHRRVNKTERERIYRLGNHLYPRRGLAERSIAPVYFISRYGSEIIDFIYEKMALDETGHRLLMLSEYNG